MLPAFPNFKRLELTDAADVEAITSKYPPYSDFNFVSMWSWDIKGEMRISELDGNLVVRFSDYITGEPFYSFLGVDEVNATTKKLLELAKGEELEPRLKLIPEVSVKSLDPTIFNIQEDRDNFDYMYSLQSLSSYAGSKLKTQRNLLSSFLRKNNTLQVDTVDITKQEGEGHILRLYKKWEYNNGFEIPHESIALTKLLKAKSAFNVVVVGVFSDKDIIAFSLSEEVNKDMVNCLFAKADTTYYGIYSFLMNQTAKILQEKGHEDMNYEQDLGIFNLRKAKESFSPNFLKKYRVSLKNGTS